MNRSIDDSMIQTNNNNNSHIRTNSSNLANRSNPGASGLRNSCGSPTDSGYRSVPRELDYDNSAGSKTATDPLYANVKSFDSPPQTNAVKCSVLVDSAPTPSSDSLPKNDTRQMSRATADETSTSCPSPYSDLSSPSYNSSTHSSGSRENRNNNGHPPVGPRLQSSSSADVGRPSSKQMVGGSFDTINTNVSLPEEFSLDRCPKLVELDRVPWNEKDVVTVLQKGRTKCFVNQIAIDIVPRLTYLLQRPLVRLAKEIQRLCVRFNKCTKHEVQCATKASFFFVFLFFPNTYHSLI